jgi:hypothetical protein
MALSSIIVLGMHRSGTSCLTGNLEQAGLYLGDVNRKAPYNAKGNQENRAIMDLNDAVMSESGAAWDHPPKTPPVWSKEHRDLRDKILASYPDEQIFGFKEPRTLFTLDGWLEAIPETGLVGTFRHPLTVAKSLQSRNGFPLGRGFDLWLSYNRRLLAVSQTRELPLINFDLPTDHYQSALLTICEKLDLTPPLGGFDFFETDLRHNKPPQEMPHNPALRDVYDALLSLSVRPISP